MIGDPKLDPRNLDEKDVARVEEFLSQYLPGVGRPFKYERWLLTPCRLTSTLLIAIVHTNKKIGVFGGGLSGHGFKFTSVLGEVLADLALTGRTDLPIGFLGCRRFHGR